MYSQGSWDSGQWAQPPKSPRSQRPWSPRRWQGQSKWQADGQYGGKGKQDRIAGKASGKGNVFAKAAAPQFSDLPPAPAPPKLASAPPAKATPGGGDASHSEVLLNALLQHLGTDGLPANLQSMIGAYQETNVKAEARRLHSLVSQQSSARKELQRLKQERLQFEDTWTSYIEKLAEAFAHQVKEHSEVLNQFEARETELLAQQEQAAQALQDCTAVKAKEDSKESMDLDPEEEADAAAKEQVRAKQRRLQQEARIKSVQDALAQVRDHNSAAAKEREGSRTPRRCVAPANQVIVIDPPETDGGQSGGMAVPP